MKRVSLLVILLVATSPFSFGKSFVNVALEDTIEMIDYYKNGKKKLEGRYVVELKNGKDTLYVAVGKQISYYKTGEQKGYLYFKHGIPHGEFQSYSKDGHKEKTFYYHEGKLNGPYFFFYANGKIERTGTFKNDTDYGVSHHYYENGNLALEETYNENGIQEGEVKFYNEKGVLIKTKVMLNGK